MTKGTFKKFAALLVAGTMVVGSSVTAFAEGETTTPGVAEGEGSYEGGEMKYPTLSVTLPTIPDGAYNYIADPNGLIADTAAAAYDGATFTGNQGIFFKTTDAEGETKAIYTNKSRALTLENANAQDIDVTIKMEQKEAGTASIEYSDSATFEEGDTAQKLYLAVTDDADTDAQVSALGKTAATLTTTVAGNPDNYKANYDGTKYGYILDESKKSGDKYTWESCSYTLTGALNKAATWGDEVDFPTIKVTWSYKEHTDSYLSSTTISSSSNTVTVSLPSGVTVSSVVLTKATGGTVTLVAGSHYTVSGSTYTFDASMLENHSTGSVTFTFSDETSETLTIE